MMAQKETLHNTRVIVNLTKSLDNKTEKVIFDANSGVFNCGIPVPPKLSAHKRDGKYYKV